MSCGQKGLDREWPKPLAEGSIIDPEVYVTAPGIPSVGWGRSPLASSTYVEVHHLMA